MDYKPKKFNGGKAVLVVLFLAVFAFAAVPVWAENFVEIGRAAPGVDYSMESPQNTVKVDVAGSSHNEDVYLKVLMLAHKEEIGKYFDYGNLVPAQDLYSIKVTPFKDGLFSAQPKVTVKYDNDGRLKNPYWFDWRDMQWKKIDAVRDVKRFTISFDLPAAEEVVFTLFDEPQLEGTASWYVHPKYKTELMAASTDFSFGTKLKVTALSSGKEVVVTVKDYGPDKSVHPDRVVDLSKEAFKVLAPTGAGVIRVRVEPYQDSTSTASAATLAI